MTLPINNMLCHLLVSLSTLTAMFIVTEFLNHLNSRVSLELWVVHIHTFFLCLPYGDQVHEGFHHHISVELLLVRIQQSPFS